MIKTILYIAFQYDNGKEENGAALNYKAWYENFIKLGYKVESLFYEDYLKEELQIEIIETAKRIKPDLVFFILQKDQVDINTLKTLKEQRFFIVNFFGDDQWRFDNWSSKYAPYFSACITTDKFSVDKYRNIGQNNIVRSQWASLESNVLYKNIDYKYDVSFIGGISPYRKWFVKELYKKDIKVHCFGNGWGNGRVSYEQMEEIFLTSKINLNISNSINYDIRYLASHIKVFAITLRAVINKGGKNSAQTKARNFEIPVQGGFQLTDYVASIEDYFNIGKELICYSDIDEAKELINYYLKHGEERERIKIAGIKKARKNHTFNHRIAEFMKRLEKIKSDGL
jgi:spore maturation protein CgeB